MDIKFSSLSLPKSGAVVFPMEENTRLSPFLEEIDDENKQVISNAIKASYYKGKKGKFLSILGNAGSFDRIILAGIGNKEEGIKNQLDLINLGGNICSYLNKERIKKTAVIIEKSIHDFSDDEIASNLAYGINLKSYRFDKYFTKKKEEDKPSLKEVDFSLKSAKKAAVAYDTFSSIADSVSFSRNVVSEPPNVIYPESYAKIISEELTTLGVKVEILGEKEMKKLGMGSLLGVGQGSVRESQLVIMQWNGASGKKEKKPLTFVGKGVCFDTGGISIKPSDGMEDMKYDMAGSAAVVGLIRALAARKAKVNAVGVVGLVENMPDGGAQRPSDIVKSMSGQTIEVLNTDAEGRLVLADALWYAQDRFKPRFMIDLATLTGAITVALGVHRAGLFSNNDELAENLFKAGEETGERLWRLPMGKEYDKQMDSKVADIQNISNAKGAGSITAAQFLQRFVNDVPWAHLDIAGTAWTKKELDIIPEGATGFGVRLLDRLVSSYYED